MLRVKLNPSRHGTRQFVRFMEGPELVEHAMNQCDGPNARFERLVEIIGRLVELQPASDQLQLCGIYDLLEA